MTVTRLSLLVRHAAIHAFRCACQGLVLRFSRSALAGWRRVGQQKQQHSHASSLLYHWRSNVQTCPLIAARWLQVLAHLTVSLGAPLLLLL